MQHDILKYLYDISTAINSVKEFTADCKNFNDFDQHKLVKRGVERELEIIGEAVNRILKIDAKIQISNARKIVNLRNWVIHSYDNVDSILIWVIIQKDIPVLQLEVQNLLKMK